MVPDLVGNNIGHGKITRGIKKSLELFIKAEIDINLIVSRAIKRPGGNIAITVLYLLFSFRSSLNFNRKRPDIPVRPNR
jgi:hypothetical protein